MEAAKKAILSDPNLLETLETPILSSEKKKTALYKTLKLNAASVQSKNFFDLLADNRRLSYTAKILNVFEELVMKHNDLTVIEIVSAEVWCYFTSVII